MKSYARLALIASFALLTFRHSAQASLLLEPYLGYVTGGQIKSAPLDAKYTGTEYGARVGYSIMNFAVGGEYLAKTLTDDSSPSSNTYTGGDLGIFAAFKFPILVRAFATYVPSPELKSSNSLGSSTFKSGNILKLGVGFTALPFININLEYISGTYSKINTNGIEANLQNNLTTTAYALSVSAPFTLF